MTAAEAAPGDPAVARRPCLPTIPLAAFGLVVAGTLLILIVPGLRRSEELRVPHTFTVNGVTYRAYPTWKAQSYAGRGKLLAQLIDPESSLGEQIHQGLRNDLVALRLSLDNTRGIRAVRFDTAKARLYDFTGRSIPCVPLEEVRQTARQPDLLEGQTTAMTIEPKETLRTYLVYFKEAPVMERMDRLYALQFEVDGEIYNLQGEFARAKEIAEQKAAALRAAAQRAGAGEVEVPAE